MIGLLHRLRAGGDALRLLVNACLALLALLVTRFANSLFFILLSWKIGEAEASTFTLSLSYATLFTQLSVWGLDFLLTRDVAADRSAASKLFGSFLSLRLLVSAACYGLLLAWIGLFRPYDAHTDAVILVCGATIITESVGRLCQAYFAAFERIGYITLLTTALGLLKLLIGVAVLWGGGDALEAALVVFGASLLGTMLSLILAYTRFAPPHWQDTLRHWQVAFPMVLPFALSSVLNTVETQSDTLLVSYLAPGDGVLAAGIYSAAMTIFLGLSLVFQGYRTAVLPMMARLYSTKRSDVWLLYEKSTLYVLALTLPMAALVSCYADEMRRLVFGDRFADATAVLQVVIWTLIPFAATIPLGCLLITVQRQPVMMRVQVVAMLVNVGVNVLLIPLLGPLGAAWARLASGTTMFLLALFYVQSRVHAWPVLRECTRLLGALALLLATVYTLNMLGCPWLLAAMLAGLAYLLAVVALGVIRPDDRTWLLRVSGYHRLVVGHIPD